MFRARAFLSLWRVGGIAWPCLKALERDIGAEVTPLPEGQFWASAAKPLVLNGEGKRRKIGDGACWADFVDLRV